MKKRYWVISMAVVLMLGITGCGGTTTNDVKEAVSEEDENVEDEQISADENDTGETTEAEQPVTASGPVLNIATDYYDVAEENISYIHGYYPSVEVVGENYPELKNTLESWFANYKNQYESQMQQYTEEAKQQAEDMGDNFYGYSLDYSAKAVRLDNRITSLAMEESSYTGGAHGYSYLYGITFDTQTGEELTFEKLGDIRDDIKSYIDAYIEQKRTKGYTFDVYEDAVDQLLESPSWYLNGMGLNIVFNAYDIGSYAEGRTVVTIPYAEMKNFNPDYKLEGGAMFAELLLNESVSVDVDGDETADILELIGEYDQNGDMELSLKVNDLSLDLDTLRLTNSYFVRTENGRSFVLVSGDLMSDDYVTQLIEVTSKTPEKLDAVDANLTSMSNDAFIVDAYVYVLGTYRSSRTYTFSEGTLQPVEERFTFASQEGNPDRTGPVLKSELTVLVEENGTMVEKKLSAGTTIYPVNSDGETVVGFELEDGTYGELTFERQDGIIYIDGVSEFDLFDNLPYVG